MVEKNIRVLNDMLKNIGRENENEDIIRVG